MSDYAYLSGKYYGSLVVSLPLLSVPAGYFGVVAFKLENIAPVGLICVMFYASVSIVVLHGVYASLICSTGARAIMLTLAVNAFLADIQLVFPLCCVLGIFMPVGASSYVVYLLAEKDFGPMNWGWRPWLTELLVVGGFALAVIYANLWYFSRVVERMQERFPLHTAHYLERRRPTKSALKDAWRLRRGW